MKKFIILLLAALMIVGLCVSCKEDLPVAPEEIVEDVVNRTITCFVLSGDSLEELAYEKKDPDLVAVELEHDLKEIFASGTDVKVDAETDSISIKITADVYHLSASVTGLSYSETKKAISGYFSISDSKREEGVSKTMDVKGSFESGMEDGSATYSEVKYNSKSYDPKAFSEELTKRFKPDKD